MCDALPTTRCRAGGTENLQVPGGRARDDVRPGGIRASPGFDVGDLIYRVGGVDVPDARTAVENLDRVGPRADTVVNFLRGGRPYRIKLRRE